MKTLDTVLDSDEDLMAEVSFFKVRAQKRKQTFTSGSQAIKGEVGRSKEGENRSCSQLLSPAWRKRRRLVLKSAANLTPI